MLRHPSPADEDAFLAAVRESRDLHVPWTFLPDTADGFRAMLERTGDPADELLVICLLEDGALVGVAHLSQIFLGDFRSAYLGYFGFAPYDGLGYMAEGVALVLRAAFEDVGLHRVEANVQPDNVRSITLLERQGFRREGYSPRYLKIGGRWRDHVRYAILADEFHARERGQGPGDRAR